MPMKMLFHVPGFWKIKLKDMIIESNEIINRVHFIYKDRVVAVATRLTPAEIIDRH